MTSQVMLLPHTSWSSLFPVIPLTIHSPASCQSNIQNRKHTMPSKFCIGILLHLEWSSNSFPWPIRPYSISPLPISLASLSTTPFLELLSPLRPWYLLFPSAWNALIQDLHTASLPYHFVCLKFCGFLWPLSLKKLSKSQISLIVQPLFEIILFIYCLQCPHPQLECKNL